MRPGLLLACEWKLGYIQLPLWDEGQWALWPGANINQCDVIAKTFSLAFSKNRAILKLTVSRNCENGSNGRPYSGVSALHTKRPPQLAVAFSWPPFTVFTLGGCAPRRSRQGKAHNVTASEAADWRRCRFCPVHQLMRRDEGGSQRRLVYTHPRSAGDEG